MEENKVTETIEENVDYIQALANLKASTVSKDQYAKLKEENKKLLDAIVSGDNITVNSEDTLTAKELAHKLNNFKGSDLEFVQTSLAYRDQMIEEGYNDPWIPSGHEVSPTPANYETADRIASIYRDCIEAADGNNGVFLAELQRRMTGTAMDRTPSVKKK